MIIAGLTGSIATGKSTVGKMFETLGVPVYEADALVHEIYASPQAKTIEERFPGILIDGQIDRQRLGAYVLNDKDALKKLEQLIHPLVRQKFAEIAANHQNNGTKLVIFDIPLLLENGPDAYGIDKVIVTFCDEKIQRQRALDRPAMTTEKLTSILARQMPQDEKRQRADFTLDTGKPLDITSREAETIRNTLLSQA